MRDTNQLNGNHSKHASKTHKRASNKLKAMSCKERLRICSERCKSEKNKKKDQMKLSLRGITIDIAKLPLNAVE